MTFLTPAEGVFLERVSAIYSCNGWGRRAVDRAESGERLLVYAQTRNYQETARRLGLDRRTVKGRIDPELGDMRGPGFTGR